MTRVSCIFLVLLSCALPVSPLHAEFPSHWGEPPSEQAPDHVQLPYGYGYGSSTLAQWIKTNVKLNRFPEDWGNPPAKQAEDYVELPEHYGYGSSTLRDWIADKLRQREVVYDAEQSQVAQNLGPMSGVGSGSDIMQGTDIGQVFSPMIAPMTSGPGMGYPAASRSSDPQTTPAFTEITSPSQTPDTIEPTDYEGESEEQTLEPFTDIEFTQPTITSTSQTTSNSATTIINNIYNNNNPAIATNPITNGITNPSPTPNYNIVEVFDPTATPTPRPAPAEETPTPRPEPQPSATPVATPKPLPATPIPSTPAPTPQPITEPVEDTRVNPYGFISPTGPATNAIVFWYNMYTGQTWYAPTGGWVPPDGFWVTGVSPNIVSKTRNPYNFRPVEVLGYPAPPGQPSNMSPVLWINTQTYEGWWAPNSDYMPPNTLWVKQDSVPTIATSTNFGFRLPGNPGEPRLVTWVFQSFYNVITGQVVTFSHGGMQPPNIEWRMGEGPGILSPRNPYGFREGPRLYSPVIGIGIQPPVTLIPTYWHNMVTEEGWWAPSQWWEPPTEDWARNVRPGSRTGHNNPFGFIPPSGRYVTMVISPWINLYTGQMWTFSHGGHTPPNSQWIRGHEWPKDNFTPLNPVPSTSTSK